MLIFLVLLLFIAPIVARINNKILKRPLRCHYQYLFIFALVQVVLLPLSWSNVSYLTYSVFVYIIFALMLLYFVSIAIYAIIYKKVRLNFRADLLRILLEWSCMLIVLCFTLFNRYIAFDLSFYVKIMSNFKNSVYSAENFYGNNLSNYYLYPQVYFFFSSLLNPNEFYQLYTIFVPLLTTSIFVSILFQIIDLFLPKMHWSISLTLVLTMAIIIGTDLYHISSSNNTLQAIILIISILTFFEYKQTTYWSILPMVALGFFSSTAVMLSIPIIITLILLDIRNWRRMWIMYGPLLVYIAVSLLCFVNTKYDSVLLFCIFYLIIPAIIIFIVFTFFKWIKSPYIARDLVANIKKYKISVLILFNILSFASFFIIKPNMQQLVESLIWFALIISLLSYLLWRPNNHLLYSFVSFISLVKILSTALLILCLLLKIESSSIWRLIFLNFGIGDLPILWISLITFSLIALKSLNLVLPKLNICKTLNIANVMLYSTSVIFVPISIISTYVISSNMEVNRDVYFNTSKANIYDIKQISNHINIYDKSKSFITDSPISQFLNNLTDVNLYLTYDLNRYINSCRWSYDGYFYTGISIVNKELSDKQKLKEDPNTILHLVENLIEKLDDNSYEIVNNFHYEIKTIDYIILNRYTNYANLLVDVLSKNYNYQAIESAGIIILKK